MGQQEGTNNLDQNVTHGRYTYSLQIATIAAMAKKRAAPDIRERFGTAVKFRREEMGLTQEDLAEKARIHRTYLSDVERGTRNLSLVNIERLAGALGLKMSEMFTRVEHQS
jgi:ribosome-binding protein aMBF1 (putative translation factor)